MKIRELLKTLKANETNESRDSISPSPNKQDARSNSHDKASKVTPKYLAKKLSQSELISEKEDKQHSHSTLEKISEEGYLNQAKSRNKNSRILDPENEMDEIDEENAIDYKNDKNIFLKIVEPPKYCSYLKGPVYLNDKVVKHSVVGPISLFERSQRRQRKSVGSKPQDNESSFVSNNAEPVSATTTKALRLMAENTKSLSIGVPRLNTGISEAESSLTRGTTAASPLRRKTLFNCVKRVMIKEGLNLTKKQLMSEIEEIRTRQGKFYDDIQKTVKNMRATDALCFTKQERCL